MSPKVKISIYIVTNLVNGKQYVGITNNIKKRWATHRAANRGTVLHNSIKKYGINCFSFIHIMDVFNREYAHEIEKQLIIDKGCKVPFGYNMTDGGEGTDGAIPWNKGLIGTKWPESRIGKPSPLKGKNLSEEHKKKLRKPKSPEHAEKIRMAKRSKEGRESNRRAGLARAKKQLMKLN